MRAASLTVAAILASAPVLAPPGQPLDVAVIDESAFPTVTFDLVAPPAYTAITLDSSMVTVNGSAVTSLTAVDPATVAVSLIIDDRPELEEATIVAEQAASVELGRNLGEGTQLALFAPSGLMAALTTDRDAAIGRLGGITAGADSVMSMPEVLLEAVNVLVESPLTDRHLIVVLGAPISFDDAQLAALTEAVASSGTRVHVLAPNDPGTLTDIALASDGLIPATADFLAGMDRITNTIADRYRAVAAVSGAGDHAVELLVQGARFTESMTVEEPPPTTAAPATAAPTAAASTGAAPTTIAAVTAVASTARATPAPTQAPAAAPRPTVAQDDGTTSRVLVPLLLLALAAGVVVAFFLLRRRNRPAAAVAAAATGPEPELAPDAAAEPEHEPEPEPERRADLEPTVAAAAVAAPLVLAAASVHDDDDAEFESDQSIELEAEPEPVSERIEHEPDVDLVADIDSVAELEAVDDGEPEPVPELEPDSDEAEPEPVAEPVPVVVELEPEPLVGEEVELESEPEPVADVEPEPAVAEETEAASEPVALDEPELVAESEPIEETPEEEPEPDPVAEVEPEPVEPEAEPVAEMVEHEPEPLVAEEVEPEAQPEPVEVEPELVAEVEAEVDEAEVDAEPEPAEELEAELELAAGLEPIEDTPDEEPEPTVSEPEPEPVAEVAERELEPLAAQELEAEAQPEPVEIEPEPVAEDEPQPAVAQEAEAASEPVSLAESQAEVVETAAEPEPAVVVEAEREPVAESQPLEEAPEEESEPVLPPAAVTPLRPFRRTKPLARPRGARGPRRSMSGSESEPDDEFDTAPAERGRRRAPAARNRIHRGAEPTSPRSTRSDPGWIVSGPVRMSPSTGEVWRGKRRVQLNDAELNVLELLITQAGRGLTSGSILDAAGLPRDSGRSAVDGLIAQVRRKTGIPSRNQVMRRERSVVYYFDEDGEPDQSS